MELAVEKADLGEGSRTIVERNKEADKGAHYASSIEFLTIKCGEKVIKAVCKIQPDVELMRNMLHTDILFAIEVIMYKEVVPFLGVEDLFPVMYFGQAEGDYKKDVILLEDLREQGYKIAEEKLFLSIDHLRLAVKNIGKFHAASFKAKATRRETLDKMILRLKPIEQTLEPGDTSLEDCLERGIKPHLEKQSDLLQQALKAMKDKNFFDVMTTPQEPWAVIIKGDFSRNNMLYKYEGDKPMSVKFIDLQTGMYSSPANDLCFLLYLNTDKATRDLYWDSLLRDYLDSIKFHLPSDIDIDEESFYDNFAARAISGYYNCSYFTPIMMEEKQQSMEEYSQLTMEERSETMTTLGGEKATQVLADIIEHLLEKGYIQKFVDLANSFGSKT